MAGRWNLIAMFFCAVLFPAICGEQATAQAPGIRPEDPRIAAMRNRMRSGALSVQREDLNKLIQSKSPVAPVHPAGITKPKATGHPNPPMNTKPKATLPHDQASGFRPEYLFKARPSRNRRRRTSAAAGRFRKTRPKPQTHIVNGQPMQPVTAHPTRLAYRLSSSRSRAAPGRLDWTFVVSRHSLDPPKPQTAGYELDGTELRTLYSTGAKSRHPMGLILHVSAQKSDGWAYFQSICQKHGIVLPACTAQGTPFPTPGEAESCSMFWTTCAAACPSIRIAHT